MAGHGPALVELTLPADASAPSQARKALRRALSGAVSESCADVIALLSTELITNAVMHAHSPAVLRVWVDEHQVRVEVQDHSPAAPRVRHYGRESTTGRGMRLVQNLARRWGTAPVPPGKLVWFELSIPTDPSAVEVEFSFDIDGIDAL